MTPSLLPHRSQSTPPSGLRWACWRRVHPLFRSGGAGNEGILVLRHGFSESQKIPFRELECAANAFRDGLGNVIRFGGFLGSGVLWRSRFPNSRESDATYDKKRGGTRKSHSILLDSEKHIRSSGEKSTRG